MNDNDWKKISSAFFKTPAARPSDDFVDKVMARIDSPAPMVVFDWRRWFIPLAGMAVLPFLFLNSPVLETPPSTEELLLANETQDLPVSWMVNNSEPSAGDVIGIATEER